MDIVLRAGLAFFFVLLLTRVVGRRELSSLEPFDLILLVMIGDLVQQGVTQEDYSLTGVLLAVGTFGFWVTALDFITWRSQRVRRLVEGVPLVIIEDGRPVEKTLRLEQIPWEEVLEAARQEGIDDVSNVRLGVLEVNGKMSFITA